MRGADDPGEPGYEATDEYNQCPCPLDCGATNIKSVPSHLRNDCEIAEQLREGEP